MLATDVYSIVGNLSETCLQSKTTLGTVSMLLCAALLPGKEYREVESRVRSSPYRFLLYLFSCRT